MFTCFQPFPGVIHIQDCLGCCQTLLVGSQRAILFDTGYGIEDIHTFVRSITPLPLTVVLSHGHHDHIMGSSCFENVYMDPDDMDDFMEYSSSYQRSRIVDSAISRNIGFDTDQYMSAMLPLPLPLQQNAFELGGMKVDVVKCPGHTQGSVMLYIEKYKLLLTADNWNPCVWAFFPRALPIQAFRDHMLKAMKGLDFDYVLCSHQHRLFEAHHVRDFYESMTDKQLETAKPVTIEAYSNLPLVQYNYTPDHFVVFDHDKYTLYLKHCEE